MKSLCTSCKHKDACDRDRRIIGYPNFRVTECVEYERKEKKSKLDLINRQDAIEAIEGMPNAYNGWSDTYDKACIIGVLEEIPSADAVEVARCKDCMRYMMKQADMQSVNTEKGDSHD